MNELRYIGNINDLPYQFTGFVGRESDIVDAKHIITSSRLLTLIGAGGIGKTRLALQIVREMVASGTHPFDGGIGFIELDNLADPALLPSVLIQEIDGVDTEKPLAAARCDYADSKKTMLIFDNCEHVIEACAHLIETLLSQCPQVHILVTSREVLRISGETVMHLSPLAIPDLYTGSDDELTTILHCESVQLFVERARLVDPHFCVTHQNASGIVHICRWLEGIPLAIELAASQIHFMPVEQMVEQFMHTSCFSLLSSGRRTVPSRQRTLRATLDWSYNLLSEDEQALLRWVSVFSNGWDLEAFSAICCSNDRDYCTLLEILARLVSKSLVQVDVCTSPQGLTSSHEQITTTRARYSLLKTVQQYAIEKLRQAGEAEPIQRRHLEYYLSLAERAEPELRSADQCRWRMQLEAEYENLCTALRNASSCGYIEEGARLASALWWFWMLRTSLSEGRQQLNAILSFRDRVPHALYATLLYRTGVLAFFQGDLEATETLTLESLALFRDQQDNHGIAIALSNLVHVALRWGDYELAQRRSEESLAIARSVGDNWYLAFVLLPCAVLKARQGYYTEATALGEEAFKLFLHCGDRSGLAYALDVLGRIASAQRDFVAADHCFHQSLTLFEILGHANGKARSLLNLGLTHLERGNYAEAGTLLEQSLQLCQKFGRRIGMARALLGLGRIALSEGNYQYAVATLGQGLTLFDEHRDTQGVAGTLYNLGQIDQLREKQQKTIASPGASTRLYVTNSVTDHDMFLRMESNALRLYGRQSSKEWLLRVDTLLRDMRRASSVSTAANTAISSMSMVRRVLEKYPDQFFSSREQVSTNVGISDSGISLAHEREMCPRSSTQKLAHITEALTPREQEVLRLVAQGMRNAQVAHQLVMSVGTVRTHLESIYSKLGVANRTAAAHYAQEHHLF